MSGPPGIQSQADADRAASDLLGIGRRRMNDTDAYVVACFSDPGLHALREETGRPVFGIAEAGILAALTLGERIGILAILARSLPRHLRYIRQMGLASRFVGDRPVDIEVVGLSDADRTLARMIEVGRELRDRDGADVLVMGCAGMADYRAQVELAVGVPVVEPTQAAVGLAVNALLRGW